MLSPKDKGSAWDLPAGVYSVDEEIGQEGSNSGAVEEGSDADMGGSPTYTINRDGGSNSDMGGSPRITINRDGGSNSDMGGSPRITINSNGGSNSNMGGSPRINQ